MAPAGTGLARDTTLRSRRRPEIEGLRGLAAVLVVIYHVWVGRVSGGVDVFFLLSGFLVVGGAARTAIRGGDLDVGRAWTRSFWRLVPTAGLVLLTSTVVAALVLPASRWGHDLRELLAATVFLENWRLAFDAVDYYADNGAASVAQHFWSLSIQAQLYLAAPVLVVVVAALARARGVDVRHALLAALGATAVVSFVHSVVITASDQPFAYFDARARAWEFALGGVLALVLDDLRPSRGVRRFLGWAGLVGLVSCGAVLDVGAGFPGFLALWPVLAAAAILVAGEAGGADRLLTTPLAQYLGRVSYPLYLWHWPVLTTFLVLTGTSAPGLAGGLLVVVVSLALAVATHHLVEQPAQRLAPERAAGAARRIVIVALPLVPALVALGVWAAVVRADAGAPIALDDPAYPGAAALAPDHVPAVEGEVPLRPSLSAVREDWFVYRRDCAAVDDHPGLEQCVPIPASGTPVRRVVLVGDSHMQQLLAALEPLAQERNWEVRTLVRARCPFSTVSETDPDDASCTEWNAAAVAHLAADPPDLVVVGATRDARPGPTEATPRGFVEGWQQLDALGLPVLAVRDNPRFDHEPAECVEAQGRGAPACDVPRADLLTADPPYAVAEGVPGNVRFLDLSDRICTPTTCPPEVGNVLVYLDDNHLSASYGRTMSSAVREQLPPLLGW